MGADGSEQQPLLASPVATATKTERSWRFAWWQVAGDGSAHDVAACCLAWNAPPIAFGWNSGRGLGLKWWLEGLKFFMLTTVLFYALYGAAVGVQSALCGEPPHSHHGTTYVFVRGAPDQELANRAEPQYLPLPEGAVPEGAAELQLQAALQKQAEGMAATLEREHKSEIDAWSNMCASRMLPWIPLVVLAGSVFMAAAIMFAARRRTLLRERFGIQGTFAGDCCLWTWCSTCALAQETRTMMHNNVEEGLWLGPHSMHSAQQHYTPVPQDAPATEPPVIVVAAPAKV